MESALGTPLPADYKAFISLYGSGVFSDSFWVCNYVAKPEAARKQLDYVTRLIADVCGETTHVAELLHRPLAAAQHPLPYPIFPQPDGLFPWGSAQDGWDFYWLQVGQPEDWSVVATYKVVERHIHFPGVGLCQFLVSLIDNPFDKSLQLDSESFVPDAVPS